MAAKKQMSFEQAMDRLEEIVKKLESGDGSLDQALTLFEEGSKLPVPVQPCWIRRSRR